MKALWMVVLAPALTAAQPQRFEVASVRVADGNAGVQGGCHGIDSKYSPLTAASAPPLGRCVISNGRLGHIIDIAWDLRQMQLIQLAKGGGPDWALGGDDRYTIEAKVDDPAKTTEAQLLEMLQTLLVERFKLKFHMEPSEKPGFAMVVGKNGPKLKAAKGEEITTSFGAQFKPFPGQPVDLTARKYSMAMLANLLSQIGPGPVVDKTGLTGEYDFTLSWDETNGPTLSTAVQEQLGLRFEAQKVPISMFVIDSAEKPKDSEN
jgi:uncharacterized protein (TIGR03435 family)